MPPDYATCGDKRTLSTYIDAITDAVTLYQAAGRCVLLAQQINDLQNDHAPSIVGNFVSHYETGAGTPFNAYALLGVLQSIDDLGDCFTWVDPANSQKKYYRRIDLPTELGLILMTSQRDNRLNQGHKIDMPSPMRPYSRAVGLLPRPLHGWNSAGRASALQGQCGRWCRIRYHARSPAEGIPPAAARIASAISAGGLLLSMIVAPSRR